MERIFDIQIEKTIGIALMGMERKGIRFFTQVLEKVQKKVSPEDLEFKFCREATRGVVWMDLENNKPIGLTSLE